MSDILEKICWSKSIGMYADAKSICMTETGRGIKGTVVLRRQTEQFSAGGLGDALRKMLEERFGEKTQNKIPVCIGLSPEHTFFITCKADVEASENLTAYNLLEASNNSSSVDPQSVVMDYCKANKPRPSQGQLWSIGACRRELAEQIYDLFNEFGVRDFSLRPAPWTLPLKFESDIKLTGKAWKTHLLVFLCGNSGLVELVTDSRVLLWRGFKTTEQNIKKAALSNIRTLLMHAAGSLGTARVTGMVLYGGDETTEVFFRDNLGLEVINAGSASLSDEDYSYAQAVSARQNERLDFDLLKTLKLKPKILSIFPWKLAAIVALMVCFLAFVMWQKYDEIIRQSNNLKQQNATHKWAKSKRTGAIKKEHKKLTIEVGAVSDFVSTRIIWSNYLRDLPTYLPDNAMLENLWCFNELQISSKKFKRKTKKSVTLRGMTQFPKGRAAPEEIEMYLESLRQADLLQKDFPNVQLAEVKWRRDGEREIAMFTVIALPGKG